MIRKSEQLPLAFGHEPQTGRDDLLVSDPLSAAISVVDSWPNWPSPVVILAGPIGSGKSHLASIWREKSGAVDIHPEADSEASVIAASHPVLFEDADRRGFDDTALFHVINSVRENGSHLLITSRLWPMSWPVALPDLRSRLKAATVVEIGEPDDELLAQVLVKLFADRQLFVDERLVAYIVARMERSLDAAQTIVEQLDRLALSRASRISRALAAEVLDSLGNKSESD
ncbi:chromosomal replication initiation ATPase DnaA [Pararhizobium capsulatum DSM 1112]|uniref:Chromosomal replication initiation ATPase DnaA n=1 Tax=Pararhizobium capsulatum DSM 1112 TaxID=1121113 RepID=A0ABU0BNI3_9HYPH|nr:DnaA regulatory inactivator HdaA [Pararhizobium capsulatum]MDQ0319813.1 chromosomal replication initiation ATPase DnaA [Pararhizobium capsulatum DSM 1112]